MSKSRTFFSLFLKYNYWTSEIWSCYDESVKIVAKKNQPIEFNPFANFVRYKMTNLLFNTWNALLNHLPANGSACLCALEATVLTPTTMKISVKNPSV
jgi:hypothetical protein